MAKAKSEMPMLVVVTPSKLMAMVKSKMLKWMVSPSSQNVGINKVDGEAPHPNVGVGIVDDAKVEDGASP